MSPVDLSELGEIGNIKEEGGDHQDSFPAHGQVWRIVFCFCVFRSGVVSQVCFRFRFSFRLICLGVGAVLALGCSGWPRGCRVSGVGVGCRV